MHLPPENGGYRLLMVGDQAGKAAALRVELEAVATVPLEWQAAPDVAAARALIGTASADAMMVVESGRRTASGGEAIRSLIAAAGDIPVVVIARAGWLDTGMRAVGRMPATHYVDQETPAEELWRTLSDVIERRRSEARLRNSEAMHRSTVAALAEGVVVQDRAARIVTCNSSAERILGRTQAEIVGHTSLDPDGRVIREDGSPFSEEELPWWIALHTGAASRDVLIGVHRPDNRLIWLSVNCQPVCDPIETQPRSVVCSFSDITARRETERRLRSSLAEKEVLLREIHHRVKNNLQVISSLLALEAMKVDAPEVQELFDDSQNRIRTMALIHEKLYRTADLASINFPQYLRSLAEMVVASHQHASTARVRIAVAAEHVALELTEAIPLALITNELLTNACKHAFKGRAGGDVHVTLRHVAPEVMELVVSDNGVGSGEAPRKKGVGLELVQMLARQLRGELTVAADDRGFRCTLRFVLGASAAALEDTKKPQPVSGCG